MWVLHAIWMQLYNVFGQIKGLTKYLLRPNKIAETSSNKTKYKLTSEYIEILQKLWLKYDIEYHSLINLKNIMSERILYLKVYKQMIQNI